MGGDRRLQGSECTYPEAEVFRLLVEHLPVAVFAMDAEGRPFYANAAAIHLLGRGADASATPEKLAEIYQARLARTTEPYPAEDMPVVRALAGESSVVDDMEVLTPEDAVVPLEVRAAPIGEPSGVVRYAVAAFYEISQRKAAEQQRSQLHEDLSRRAEWLEAVGEVMAATAAHREAEDVLRLVTGRARQLVSADTAILAQSNRTGDGLALAVVDGEHSSALQGAVLPLEGSLMGSTLTHRETLVLADLSADPRSHRLLADLGSARSPSSPWAPPPPWASSE
jgi:PAS domain S-box-containing protein